MLVRMDVDHDSQDQYIGAGLASYSSGGAATGSPGSLGPVSDEGHPSLLAQVHRGLRILVPLLLLAL